MAPIFPTASEMIANMMPITDNIKVMVHAQLLPLHKPYATTRNAMPIAKNKKPIPITRKTAPLARNIIPPIAVRIATIETPKGLCFWLSIDTLSNDDSI